MKTDQPEAAGLTFPCQQCGQELRHRETSAGHKFRCPVCTCMDFIPPLNEARRVSATPRGPLRLHPVMDEHRKYSISSPLEWIKTKLAATSKQARPAAASLPDPTKQGQPTRSPFDRKLRSEINRHSEPHVNHPEAKPVEPQKPSVPRKASTPTRVETHASTQMTTITIPVLATTGYSPTSGHAKMSGHVKINGKTRKRRSEKESAKRPKRVSEKKKTGSLAAGNPPVASSAHAMHPRNTHWFSAFDPKWLSPSEVFSELEQHGFTVTAVPAPKNRPPTRGNQEIDQSTGD